MHVIETDRQKVLYSKHFVTSHKCPLHVTFDLVLDLEHTLDAVTSRLKTSDTMCSHTATAAFVPIVCKFGGDPAICLREEAIFVNSWARPRGAQLTAGPCSAVAGPIY